MAFNTSQFQTGAFNGNQFGNFMSGGFTSPTSSPSNKTKEDDTYNPRYPWFNKENYEKLERKVAALWLTGSKKQEVMDEFYRQILPQVENEKIKSQRNEAINQKSYEISQIKDESERKIAEKNLSVEQLAQMVKEKEGLREDAPDAAVFNAWINSIPEWDKLLANYMNNGDDTLLYKGWLKKETWWQKAWDVAVWFAQSPWKWGYNIIWQWMDRLWKWGAEQLSWSKLEKWVQDKAIEMFWEDEVRAYAAQKQKELEEGTAFNGREQTDIRTPLLWSEYRANNGWTKAWETVWDIATWIALTAPIWAALAPAIAWSSAAWAAWIGAVEWGIDTLLTQYGSQGNLDVTPMQMVLWVWGWALWGWLSNRLANLPKNQTQSIRKEAEWYIDKSIRPTVKWKQNQVAYDKFMDDTLDITDYMSKNKWLIQYTDDAWNTVTWELPTNLNQTREALGNMKKHIYDTYNQIAKDAWDAWARVDLNKVFSQLDDLADDAASNIANPWLKSVIDSYKTQLLEYSDDLGRISIEDAQKLTQNYNKILDAYFKNPWAYANDTSRNIVIAQMNRWVKDAIDDSIDDVMNASIKNGSKASETYKYYKQLYGKIKTIEDEVSKSALREMRKNTKGISSQVIDALAWEKLVEWLLTKNPTSLFKSIAMKSIDAYNKYLNNPNTQINNLFKLVDRANNPSAWTTAMSNITSDLWSSIGSDVLAQAWNLTTNAGIVAWNVISNTDLD